MKNVKHENSFFYLSILNYNKKNSKQPSNNKWIKI